MLRRMRDDDLDAVEKIEQELFSDHPWDREAFRYELHDNPYALCWVDETDGQIAGYVDLWVMFEHADIANIAVSKSMQRKGIASKMMQQAVNEAEHKGCETLTLEVRVSNRPAISLYEKFGFIRANIRKHYYDNGEDAILMIKPLGGIDNDNDTGN